VLRVVATNASSTKRFPLAPIEVCAPSFYVVGHVLKALPH
jgi:hypothetical protein